VWPPGRAAARGRSRAAAPRGGGPATRNRSPRAARSSAAGRRTRTASSPRRCAGAAGRRRAPSRSEISQSGSSHSGVVSGCARRTMRRTASHAAREHATDRERDRGPERERGRQDVFRPRRAQARGATRNAGASAVVAAEAWCPGCTAGVSAPSSAASSGAAPGVRAHSSRGRAGQRRGRSIDARRAGAAPRAAAPGVERGHEEERARVGEPHVVAGTGRGVLEGSRDRRGRTTRTIVALRAGGASGRGSRSLPPVLARRADRLAQPGDARHRRGRTSDIRSSAVTRLRGEPAK
jgi:hypothetical protein